MARSQPSPSTARAARCAVLALGAFWLLAGCTSSAWDVSIDSRRLSELKRWADDQPHVDEVVVLPEGVDAVDLEVFLDLDRPDGDAQLEADLRADPLVRKVVFIDQAEQFELFREYVSDQPEYLDVVRAEDLPASYRVYLRAPAVRIESERNRDDTYRIALEATRRDELVVSFSYRSRAGREREVKRFTVVVS
jgi:hypothetical protein